MVAALRLVRTVTTAKGERNRGIDATALQVTGCIVVEDGDFNAW
jgi:hypothetical protein